MRQGLWVSRTLPRARCGAAGRGNLGYIHSFNTDTYQVSSTVLALDPHVACNPVGEVVGETDNKRV